MSTRPPDNIGPLDHLALRYLRQALDMSHPTDEPYVLNPIESRLIRRTKAITLSMVVILSLVGIALFYWPQYSWPELFNLTAIRAFGAVHTFPLVTILYGLLLVYLQIGILLVLTSWGAKMIMDVCRFPSAHDPQYEKHLQALSTTAFQYSYRNFFRSNVDSYLNIPRWGLFILFLSATVKAALTTLLMKFSLTRFIGQYALADMTAMPIYALWNTWTSWQVLHEAQVRVMAPTTIREFVHELHQEWGTNDQFRQLIPGALHHVAVLQRQYNYAHYLLTETLTDQFKLEMNLLPTDSFVAQVLQTPLPLRRSLERLIVFSVLIDGKLSWFEKRRLRELRRQGLLTYSTGEIQRMITDYNQGRGLWV